AENGEGDGRIAVLLRRLRTPKRAPRRRRTVSGLLANAPIVMVALDLAPEAEGLREALATAVRRVLATEPGARLACINVLKTSRLAIDPEVDEHGRNLHLQRLVALRHWARVPPVAGERVTYPVIEAGGLAAALVGSAPNQQGRPLAWGARGASPLRTLLG